MNRQARRLNAHGMALQFAFWFGCCTYISFMLMTLIDYGWTAGAATMAMTVMPAVTLFTQPVYGYVSDRYLSEKSLCVILLSAVSVCLFLFPIALDSGNMAFVFAVMGGISVVGMQVAGLLDAWIVGLKQENEAVNYGLIRGAGAFAFAISAIICGWVTINFGHGERFWLGAAVSLIGAGIALTYPAAKKKKKIKT
jgi:predicted MFS family arabinose efflux permease